MNWGNIFGNTASGAMMGAPFGMPGAAIGGGLGLLSGLFGGDPEEAARKASEQGLNQARGYQLPFIHGGMDQYGRLNQATGDLMNPEGLESKWAAGYQNSPYAKQLLSQNQSAGMDAASAMGLGGSSAALGNIQQGAGNIVSQDRQQYMNDLMQKYMSGIGLGSNLYGVGATSANKLGEQEVGQGLVNAFLASQNANRPMQNMAAAGGGLLDFYKSNPDTFKSNWSGFLS